MNWFYAVAGQQQGPVDDAQLEALLQSGQIQLDTLVWREGMAGWKPLREARGTSAAAAGIPTPAPAAALSPPTDPAERASSILQRDVNLDIGACLGRAWDLVKGHLGIAIGAVVVAYLCIFGANLIPCVGSLIGLLVQGPIMAGLYVFFLKLIRGQEAEIGDVFSCFSGRFLQLFLTVLVTGLLTGLCVLPGAAALVAITALKMKVSVALVVVLFAIGVVPAVYLSVCWIFALPIVADQQLDFWPAMELSRRVVSQRWGSVFLLLLAGSAVTMLGVLALCVGLLVALPVVMASLAYAYEDLFGSSSSPQA